MFRQTILLLAAALAGAPALRGQAQAVARPSRDASRDVRPDSLLFVPLEHSAADRARFVEAYRRADRFHARRLYEAFLDRIGANGLIDAVQTLYPRCHDEGHDLGKVIFGRLRDVNLAMRACDDACNSGCMHGVVTEFFTVAAGTGPPSGTAAHGAGGGHAHGTRLTPAMVREAMPTICGPQTLRDTYLPGDCAHGVGHAALFLSNYDVEQAVAHCDLLDSHAMRYYCATGVYMEYRIERADADYRTRGPFYPCDRSPYPAACFRYKLVSTFAQHYRQGRPLAELATECAKLGTKYRLGCFHGIGNAHMGLIARGAVTIADVCRFGGADDRTVCIEGAMERLGKFHGEVAAERCTVLAARERAVCLESASRKMYDLKRSFVLYPR